MSRTVSSPPVIQEHWTPRSATVHSLYERLTECPPVVVRGPPGSGKTTLMDLLHAHILSQDHNAVVEVIKGWRKDPGTQYMYEERMVEGIKTYPCRGPRNHYLLFDDAQETYWDKYLWENFFKDTVQRHRQPFAILFCRYGSPSYQPVDYDGNPLHLWGDERISLAPYQSSALYHPGIGLLFSREEFDEAVDRFKSLDGAFICVDQDLRQMLFEWTMGHPGAVGDLLHTLCSEERTKLRDGGTLTIDDLLNVQQAGTPLSDLPSFSKGLPSDGDLRNAGVANVFRKLLTQGRIMKSGDPNEDFCHRHGWIHAGEDMELSCYAFPSPLHAAYVSWKLMPTIVTCPFVTVRDMTFSILKKFNPSRLSSPSRVGVACSERPLESRYQFEFYRGLFEATGGGARFCPELLMSVGGCKSPINFFVPEKKWGIELTRDGNGLLEHSFRLGIKSKYGEWLTSNDMVDYIILDFRTDIPSSTNPHIQNLFHVVFEEQFRRLTILDNMLEIIEEPFELSEVL